MARTQHYVWAAGHFLLLVSAFRYFFVWITFQRASAWWYKAGYAGALVSYAIVCQKSLGTPQLSSAFIQRALLDENVQYFMLAFYWWSSKPIAITLLPYMIFSLFHALTFIRTTLMPQFLSARQPNQPQGSAQAHPIAKKLQSWVKGALAIRSRHEVRLGSTQAFQANYDTAMRLVAYIELGIFARVLFGALTLRNALLSPLFYVHFLRQRYYQSAFTREAVGTVRGRIDGFIRREGISPVVVMIWDRLQMFVQRWGGGTLEPAEGPRPGEGTPRR